MQGKVLFLAANPSATTRLALDIECRTIDERLKAADRPLTLESRWAVRTTDLQNALLETGPKVVHFSGHGSGKPGIMLQGERSIDVKYVTGPVLRGMFEAFADTVEVVVMNACYAEEQAHAIVEVIDAVVGMKTTISDGAAISFSLAFYQALAFDRKVDVAFKLGVNQIELDGYAAERDTPVLLRKG